MQKMLITGFEPFGNNAVNSSQEVLRTISAMNPTFCKPDCRCLPVTYHFCEMFAANSGFFAKYHAILMLGLAEKNQRLRLERAAVNLMDSENPDNSGLIMRNKPIISGGAEQLRTSIPLESLKQVLEIRGYSCEISESAGKYVCNALYYHVLHAVRRMDIPALFLHLPPASKTWPVTRLAAATLVILSYLAQDDLCDD